MVVPISDSTSTLQSLREQGKQALISSSDVAHSTIPSFQSALLLADSNTRISLPHPTTDEHVESWLSEPLAPAHAALLEHPVVEYKDDETTGLPTHSEKLLYVSQRELAHATPSQCDVLVSDRATTCHILMVRSYTTSNSQYHQPPLVSCAHLDGPYDSSLDNLLHHHYEHHFHTHCKTSIQVDYHIIGGFDDARNKSRPLTQWLLYRCADLAQRYESHGMVFRICTFLVTTLNHDAAMDAPHLRGLAMRLATGEVWPAHCQGSSLGPDFLLRQARLWSSSPQPNLNVVHWHKSLFGHYSAGMFGITPFRFSSHADIEWLLSLENDSELLQNSSTSPDCEEADYCNTIRSVLKLLQNKQHYRKYFGARTPRYYQRSPTHPNLWELKPASAKNSKVTSIKDKQRHRLFLRRKRKQSEEQVQA